MAYIRIYAKQFFLNPSMTDTDTVIAFISDDEKHLRFEMKSAPEQCAVFEQTDSRELVSLENTMPEGWEPPSLNSVKIMAESFQWARDSGSMPPRNNIVNVLVYTRDQRLLCNYRALHKNNGQVSESGGKLDIPGIPLMKMNRRNTAVDHISGYLSRQLDPADISVCGATFDPDYARWHVLHTLKPTIEELMERPVAPDDSYARVFKVRPQVPVWKKNLELARQQGLLTATAQMLLQRVPEAFKMADFRTIPPSEQPRSCR